jgi:hypothetical protein
MAEQRQETMSSIKAEERANAAACPKEAAELERARKSPEGPASDDDVALAGYRVGKAVDALKACLRRRGISSGLYPESSEPPSGDPGSEYYDQAEPEGAELDQPEPEYPEPNYP